MGCSIFADVDLSTAKYLEDVVHYCPSTIGLDTIYRSKAAISSIFLKNSGVRLCLINQMASMLKDDDSNSCKINYSTVDHRVAYKIYIDLQKHGVDCWLSGDGSVFKNKQKYIIERDFTLYSKNLFLLSGNSILNKYIVSDMKIVLKEENRRKKRGRKETMFLPVRLDRFNVPKELSWINKLCDKRLVCDFSDWKKHYCYQKGIEKLLHVLVAPVSPDFGSATA